MVRSPFLDPGHRAGLSHFGDLTMADYHSPTVVQPTIPNADITPLERLLLTRIFEAEPDGDGLYFFSETGPCDTFELAVADLRAALRQSIGAASIAGDHFARRVADT